MDYARTIANTALKIKSIKLNPENPFTWASGYRMPIYNDNRMFLRNYNHRLLIINGFVNLIEIIDTFNQNYREQKEIAGTSTAGIPWATLLAQRLRLPMIYVRDKSKDHGLKNQIVGIDSESDLNGSNVILIEDLISTGGSSVNAVQTIRNANGVCNYCLSVFNYGLDKAVNEFNRLNPRCNVKSILTYNTLLDVVKEENYVNESQIKALEEWRIDPFGWGENHGFPKIDKK